MSGPILTPELIDRLGYLLAVRDGIFAKLDEASGGDPADDPSSTYHDMLRSVSLEFMDSATALVAAAKERDQLREAIRLREHALIEAWSGSLSGLEEAEAATAKAVALEELAGVCPPTVERNLDAALSKLAAVLIEKHRLIDEVERLRADRDLWMRDRDEMAVERDTARQLVDKREEERDALQVEVERLRDLALDAVDVIEEATTPTNKLATALRAQIERKP